MLFYLAAQPQGIWRLENNREKIQLAVLDQLGEGIILADKDGKIVTVNVQMSIYYYSIQRKMQILK